MRHMALLNKRHRVLLVTSLVLLIAVAGCSTHHSALKPNPDGSPGIYAVPQSQASAPIAPSADASARDAESAALAWLGLVDAGDYPQSWNAASPLFRDHVSQSKCLSVGHIEFGAGIEEVRVGEVSLRTNWWLAGRAVCGSSVYSRFRGDDEYTAPDSWVETMVMSREAGAMWRVAGLYRDAAKSGSWLMPLGRLCK